MLKIALKTLFQEAIKEILLLEIQVNAKRKYPLAPTPLKKKDASKKGVSVSMSCSKPTI